MLLLSVTNWTKRHLEKGSQATLVTTRTSGSSYRNRVELQNDCLALGHANLFIPSTLNSSCVVNGVVNDEMCARISKQQYTFISVELICTLELAHLYTYGKVPKTSSTFLKSTKKEKSELKNENTYLFCQIKVSDLRRRHMVPGIPKNYAMLFS